MRTIFCLLTLALAVVTAVAEDGKNMGKQHDYDPEKLPEVIKVKAGDSIVLTYTKIKRESIESFELSSDNNDVTIKHSVMGSVQIIIQSEKKGKAKVRWIITLDSGINVAHKQQVEFE